MKQLIISFILLSSFAGFSQTLLKAEKQDVINAEGRLLSKHYHVELKKPQGSLFQLDSAETSSGQNLDYKITRSDEASHKACSSVVCKEDETILVTMDQENLLNKKEQRILTGSTVDFTDGVILYYRNGEHLKRLVVKTFTEVPSRNAEGTHPVED